MQVELLGGDTQERNDVGVGEDLRVRCARSFNDRLVGCRTGLRRSGGRNDAGTLTRLTGGGRGSDGDVWSDSDTRWQARKRRIVRGVVILLDIGLRCRVRIARSSSLYVAGLRDEMLPQLPGVRSVGAKAAQAQATKEPFRQRAGRTGEELAADLADLLCPIGRT